MPPESDNLERVHSRIDDVAKTLNELLETLTYNRATNKPGILPRLDSIEASSTQANKAIDDHMREHRTSTGPTLASWSMDMGTYVLKVLLAALAMYIAASAKRGMVLDMAQEANTSMINFIEDGCDDCQVAGR